MTAGTEPVTPDSISEDDPRILQASREYLAELEAGKQPDRQAYLARYPGLAGILSECLDGIELAQTLRPPALSPPVDQSGSPLGDFQILREIGRGGMGVVYEAVQLSLGRRVALKVLPFANALDSKHLQRFKTEAYAAAQLHHTNIVPVYAVGCERGMHFYAMQLIKGRSLADVIRELRDEAQMSDPRPEDVNTVIVNTAQQTTISTVHDSARSSPRSLRTRDSFRISARIAAEIADALEYAHDAGVVHRDIKPANLLMDARGAVWVADFGLAQVATDVGLTQTGDLLGTLRYMSPEQAGGRRQPVDHRTDVYSLGATLYEMLTLHPIFPGQDRSALLHQILHEDPLPLRQLDRAIPIELETIVLKSLSKLPSERYATAEDMAADLRRFLNEMPILARRPQLIDRVRKWTRRHPTIVAATVILLVFSLIGLSVMTAIVSREHAKTEQRAEEAEQQFKLARRAADEMIQIADEELGDQPYQEGLRKRLLETARDYYQEFIEKRGTSSVTESELAETQKRVKKILADLTLLQTDRHLFLLLHDSVLDDLELTPTQRTKIAELHDRFRSREPKWPEHRKEPQKPSSNKFREFILEQARIKEVAFSQILSPQQLQRLTQIALQWQGPMAFRELDIARTLRLTPSQKERVHQVMRTFMEQSFRRDFGPHEHGDQPERGNDDGDRVRQAVQHILVELNPMQRAEWQKLTGKPFLGALPMPFGRGPGHEPGRHPEGRRGPPGGPRPPF